MILLTNQKTIFFDVDDTLVMDGFQQNGPLKNKLKKFKSPWGGPHEYLLPHESHIAELKRAKREGFTVVVWSAGGALWANEVVRVLKLKDHVDVILSKPSEYWDDIDANDFMTRKYTTYKYWEDPDLAEEENPEKVDS